MKTPEEYLAQQGGFFPNDNTSRAYFEQDALAALTAMKQDAERELQSIEQSLERIESSPYAADPILEDVCIKDIRGQVLELLTQFRKG